MPEETQIPNQNQTTNKAPLLPKERLGGVNPRHHITPWVALVIIAAVAATVGYLIWAKAHEAWPFDYDGPWSEVRRDSETAGWKTYRNEEYGFEFKYPANFPFGSGFGETPLNRSKSVNTYSFYIYQVPGPRAEGESTTDLVIIPAEYFRTDMQTPPVAISSLEQILPFYTNSSYQISRLKTNSGEDVLALVNNSYFATYYLLKKGYVYEFRNFKKDDESLILQILSTFKFISP